jgi:hypothetical protein
MGRGVAANLLALGERVAELGHRPQHVVRGGGPISRRLLEQEPLELGADGA